MLFGGMATQFGACLRHVSHFDTSAFSIPLAEATLMDPQQRLLLLCAAEALAQTRPQTAELSHSAAACGGFVGVSSMDYNKLTLKYGAAAMTPFNSTGASLSVTAGRLAFAFNLRGMSKTQLCIISMLLTAVTMLSAGIPDVRNILKIYFAC